MGLEPINISLSNSAWAKARPATKPEDISQISMVSMASMGIFIIIIIMKIPLETIDAIEFIEMTILALGLKNGFPRYIYPPLVV
jgi:hypothetical protein